MIYRFVVVCLLLGALLAGCAQPMPVPMPQPGDGVVYVVGRGWHTDIVLPVEEIVGPLARTEALFPGVRFLTFGFGERTFVVDRRADVFSMLGALLPSRSAVLMTALRATPDEAFGAANVVALHVSRAGLERIETAVWRELGQPADGTPAVLADGPYSGSVFFAAQDTYDGLFTCNSWTAQVLRQGGLPMPPALLFSGQIMGMARWLQTQQAGSGLR